MITIQFELPDEVGAFIRDELKVEPKTYIQNELIKPIVDKYQASLKAKRHEEVEAEVNTKVASVKNSMKVEVTDDEKKRKK